MKEIFSTLLSKQEFRWATFKGAGVTSMWGSSPGHMLWLIMHQFARCTRLQQQPPSKKGQVSYT